MNGNTDSERDRPRRLTPCGQSRREFLWESAGGFVGTALATLLAEDGFFARRAAASEAEDASAAGAMAPKKPHFPAKAKACIVLFMYGGVSQVDTFDPKTDLTKHHGKPIPILDSDPLLKVRNPGKLLASSRKFPPVRRGGDDRFRPVPSARWAAGRYRRDPEHVYR